MKRNHMRKWVSVLAVAVVLFNPIGVMAGAWDKGQTGRDQICQRSLMVVKNNHDGYDDYDRDIPTTRRINIAYESTSSLRCVGENSFYGALIGLGVALAVNLIADKYAWELGPAIGVGFFGGIGWGVYEYNRRQSRHLASLENGRLKLGMPGFSVQVKAEEEKVDLHLLACRF